MAMSVCGYCVSPKMFLSIQVSVTNAFRLQLSRILREGQKSKSNSPVVSFTCCPTLVQMWPWDHRESSWPDFSTSPGASPPRGANVWLLCSELTAFCSFPPSDLMTSCFCKLRFPSKLPLFLWAYPAVFCSAQDLSWNMIMICRNLCLSIKYKFKLLLDNPHMGARYRFNFHSRNVSACGGLAGWGGLSPHEYQQMALID